MPKLDEAIGSTLSIPAEAATDVEHDEIPIAVTEETQPQHEPLPVVHEPVKAEPADDLSSDVAELVQFFGVTPGVTDSATIDLIVSLIGITRQDDATTVANLLQFTGLTPADALT